MKPRTILFLLLTLTLLALPISGLAGAVGDGSVCPSNPDGGTAHAWQVTGTTAANCQHGVITSYSCGYCGKTFTSESSEKGDHQFGDVQTIEATCTAAGGTRRVCSVCGYVDEQLTVDPLGHDFVADERVEPTCTEDGFQHSVCSRCGADGGNVTLTAAGHTWGDWVTKEATCTEDGSASRVCSVCGTEEQTALPALGHSWDEGTVITPAACTEDGQITYACTRCGETRTETIPQTGHVPSPVPAVAATCTQSGLTEGSVCSVCGVILTEQTVTPARGHWWDEGVITIAPTETETGVRLYTCRRDITHTYVETIPALGHQHVWGEWVQIKAPTAGVPGLEERVCETDPTHIEQREIPALDINAFLTLTLEYLTPEKSVYQPDDTDLAVGYTLRNDGDVAMNVALYEMQWFQGEYDPGYNPHLTLLAPGDAIHREWDFTFGSPVKDYIKPGTQTADLMGVAEESLWYVGLDPVSGEKLCESNRITVSAPVDRDPADGPSAEILFSVWWDEGAGEGKRAAGAEVSLHCAYTNLGECPVYHMVIQGKDVQLPNGFSSVAGLGVAAPVNPGDTISWVYPYTVTQADAEAGEIAVRAWETSPYYQSFSGEWKRVQGEGTSPALTLTWPNGAEIPAPQALLTLADLCYDQDLSGQIWTDGSHDPADSVLAAYSLINSGDVPLTVRKHYSFSNGISGTYAGDTACAPGEMLTGSFGVENIQEHVTPGTAAEDALGNVEFTFWFTGHDPKTGEEICKSDEIRRVWQVLRPTGDEQNIQGPGAVRFEAVQYSLPADPRGLQLGETWFLRAEIANVGLTDIGAYTVRFPNGDALASPTALPADQTAHSWVFGMEQVTAEDVARGYLLVNPTVIWTDPDSGEKKTACLAVALPVSDQTGLLVQKSVKNAPQNGSYFAADETIQWFLTVTNNSPAPISSITVTDQGNPVGVFAQIAPGETRECALPAYTVTELDEIKHSISTQAMAVGTDSAGCLHTYAGNTLTVPTSAKGAKEHPLPPAAVGFTAGGDAIPPAGDFLNLSIRVEEISAPRTGAAYQENEEAAFLITLENNGLAPLDQFTLLDSLAGFDPIGTLPALDPGEEAAFAFRYTVTAADADQGSVTHTALASFTVGGLPAIPVQSSPVTVRTGSAAPSPDGLAELSPLSPAKGGSFDADKLPGPADAPILAPLTLPDGAVILAPEGTVSTLTAAPDGSQILLQPDGSHFILGPDGVPILTDENGMPITDGDGDLIYLDFDGDSAQCGLTLTKLGAAEAHYVLHACAEHTDAAQAAERASLIGTAEGWKQAANIWRAEIDKLYQVLFDAANDGAKAAVISDRAALYAYVEACQALPAGENAAAAQRAAAEILRLRCAELCSLAHAAPVALNGDYTTLLDGEQYADTARTVSLLSGSDAEITETYGAALAGILNFPTRQQWQQALDQRINALYAASDLQDRQAIAASRILLDQAYAAQKALLSILCDSPAAAEDALISLYKNAAIDAI